jgi:hypothetical protein
VLPAKTTRPPFFSFDTTFVTMSEDESNMIAVLFAAAGRRRAKTPMVSDDHKREARTEWVHKSHSADGTYTL